MEFYATCPQFESFSDLSENKDFLAVSYNVLISMILLTITGANIHLLKLGQQRGDGF
jgi:hypothetical protein